MPFQEVVNVLHQTGITVERLFDLLQRHFDGQLQFGILDPHLQEPIANVQVDALRDQASGHLRETGSLRGSHLLEGQTGLEGGSFESCQEFLERRGFLRRCLCGVLFLAGVGFIRICGSWLTGCSASCRFRVLNAGLEGVLLENWEMSLISFVLPSCDDSSACWCLLTERHHRSHR